MTHGFIVDGEGRKMSKSEGNVISPFDVMKQYGADILRLWVLSSDVSDDVRLSADALVRRWGGRAVSTSRNGRSPARRTATPGSRRGGSGSSASGTGS